MKEKGSFSKFTKGELHCPTQLFWWPVRALLYGWRADICALWSQLCTDLHPRSAHAFLWGR